MTDIAELGFQVNTAGLKEGSTELDRFKGKAKEVEDQVKKTDTATAKAGDGAKKFGEESKAASTSIDQMAKSSGAAEAAAKRLGISVEEYNKKTQDTKAAITAANAATQAMAPAMTAAATATQAATTATQAATTAARTVVPAMTAAAAATQSVAPAMAAAATATRTAAAAKDAAAVSSANLAAGLNVLRPAVVAAGGAMGTLPAAAAAARFGLLGVGLAAAGGAAVGLAKYGDQVEDARGKLGALIGSSEAGRKTFNDLKAASENGGAGLDLLSKSIVEVVTGLGRIQTPPGVYNLGNQAQQSAARVTAAFGEINRVITGLHIPESSFKPGLDALTKGLADATNQGRLTGDTFRQIQNASPELARVLASAFNQTNVENFRRSLDVTPRSIDQITNALKQLDLASVKGLDPSRPETFEQATAKLDRSWNNLKQSLTDVGALGFAAKAVDEIAQGISGLGRLIDETRKGGLKFDFGLSDGAKDFLQTLKDQFKSAEGEGVKFSDVIDGIGRSSDALSRSQAAKVIEGINQSLAGFADVATDIQSAATATDQFATALPLAAEAATTFAGATTEAMGGASTAIGQTTDAVATFAQGLDASMASAANSAEAGAGRIVSAMQAIIDAANAAMATQAAAAGGGFNGVGSSPYAMGAAFSGGRVIPFARGGVVTKPILFPMADGMGLMGEAGPEAVMPLARGPDGKLGVKATAQSAGIVSDPIDAFETAIKDQTQELRTAIGDGTDNVATRIGRKLDEVIGAIERGNIKVTQSAAGPANTLDSAAGTFDSAVQQFGSAVQVASGGGGQFRTSVQVGDGSGRYTSGQSFGSGSGSGTGGQLRTSVQLSSGSSGGSNALDPTFFGNRDSMFASGGGDFKPYMAPNGVMVNNPQDAEDRYWGRGKYADIGKGATGGGSSSGGRSGLPGGYGSGGSGGGSTFGGNRTGGGPPSDWAPSNNWGYTAPDGSWVQTANPYGGDYMTGDNYTPNYDYGSDTARTNDSYMSGGGDYYSGGGDYYSSPSEDFYGGAYAAGGSFTVPGAGGTDSVRVGIDATPGEVVTVTPPGGEKRTAGGISISMTVNATDAQSFLKNDHAIVAALARKLEQYQARR